MSKQNGSTKDVTSVSLDKQLIRKAANSEHINLSGLCNDLLEEYFDSGDASKARLEARRQRLVEQKEHLEREKSQLEDELDRIDRQLELKREEEQQREERIERLADQLPDDVDPDNPAVMNWAGKLDLTPATLVDRIEDHRPDVAVSSR